MARIVYKDGTLMVREGEGGEVLEVSISRTEARQLVDELPVEFVELTEALDNAQGASEEHDSVVVIVIKAGPIE